MRVLLCHRSFPGQFRWVIYLFNKVGIDVIFLCKELTVWEEPKGINVIQVDTLVNRQKKQIPAAEAGEEFAYEFKEAAKALQEMNWIPNYIVSHSGWGVPRCKEVFPTAKLILYLEWWFTLENIKYLGYDPVDSSIPGVFNAVNCATKSAIMLSEKVIVPTYWQKRTIPSEFHEKITVIEDGFPLDFFNHKRIEQQAKKKDEPLNLIYAARSLEYTRGSDRLYRLVDYIKTNNCNCKLNIVADSRRVYDDPNIYLQSEKVMKMCLDEEFITIKKQLPYDEYIQALATADIHLYLSRPFVLSWSFIESSLCGSRILSIENPASIEKHHPNHINFRTELECFEVIKHYSNKNELIKIKSNSGNRSSWLNTREGENFKNRHSIENWFRSLITIMLG